MGIIMKKWYPRIMMALLFLAVIAGIGALYIDRFVDGVVERGTEWLGGEVLGAPVTLGSYDFSFPERRLILRGVVINNPVGFQTSEAVTIDRVLLIINPSSLVRTAWVLDTLEMSGIQVTWEGSTRGSNITTLQRRAESYMAGAGVESEKTERWIIRSMIITDSKLRLSATMMHGKALDVKLADIKDRDVGEEEGGISTEEVMKMVVAPFFRSIRHTVTAVGIGTAIGGPLGGAIAIPVTGGVKKVGGAVRKGVHSLIERLRSKESGE